MYISSVGISMPENEIDQEEVKEVVKQLFKQKNINRYLPIFDHAKVSKRQFVVSKESFQQTFSFAYKNNLYKENAKAHSLHAIDRCLNHNLFLNEPFPYEGIDLIIYVSSTGIVTPSMDVHIINARPFREDINRMPLWGLGCAGGAIALSHANQWLQSNERKNVLIVCCELCSLTFQKEDDSVSNIVGTAIFGDGISATLLMGTKSKYRTLLKQNGLTVRDTSAFTKKKTINMMGWDITERGFEVIFSKRIPKLVHELWEPHIQSFLLKNNVSVDDINDFIAHPGGRKVLEAIEDTLQMEQHKLRFSYDVLKNHGNMSSVTVFYVLKQWLQHGIDHKFTSEKGILSALGPGFSSELLLLEWKTI